MLNFYILLTFFQKAVLIVPKFKAMDVLLGTPHELNDFEDLLKRLHECFKMRNNDPLCRDLIIQTCQDHCRPEYLNHKDRDAVLGAIAVAATRIANKSLLEEAISLVQDGFSEKTFSLLGELKCFEEPLLKDKK
jgi:hypothetical protein